MCMCAYLQTAFRVMTPLPQKDFVGSCGLRLHQNRFQSNWPKASRLVSYACLTKTLASQKRSVKMHLKHMDFCGARMEKNILMKRLKFGTTTGQLFSPLTYRRTSSDMSVADQIRCSIFQKARSHMTRPTFLSVSIRIKKESISRKEIFTFSPRANLFVFLQILPARWRQWTSGAVNSVPITQDLLIPVGGGGRMEKGEVARLHLRSARLMIL